MQRLRLLLIAIYLGLFLFASGGQPVAAIVHKPLAASRVVRVVNSDIMAGTSRSFVVELDAFGDETGIGFSLDFDVSRLSFVTVSLAPGIPIGSIYALNTIHTQQGRLGLGVILPGVRFFAAGTHQLFTVTLHAHVDAVQGATQISFGDAPIPREVLKGAQNIPVELFTFTPGIANILAPDYEADTSDRPLGNASLSLADWVQTGRLAVGVDTTSSASEFQRTDCAPRDTLGDGVLSLADWVQAGRYAIGLGPITPAGGPMSPPGLMPPIVSISRAGRYPNEEAQRTGSAILVSFPLSRGNVAHVVLSIDAAGVENALNFTLAFDPNRWEFVEAQSGWDALNGTLIVGRSELASGRVSAALALPPGLAVSPGWRQLVEMKFRPLVKKLERSPHIRFVDEVSAKSAVVDVFAREMAFEWQVNEKHSRGRGQR